jgi:choline dehydrogenase-like flavoprotein
MIVDGSALSSGIEKEHELCVVGSGIAGMLLVMELAPTYKDICMIESGAWKPKVFWRFLQHLGRPCHDI